MPAIRPPIASHSPHRQRGAAFMVMLVILIIGAVTILVGALNSSSVKIARDQTTADALAKAKEALIGRAVADANHPGSLPCPDIITNTTTPILNVPNDGVADSGSTCPSYIGRLPWKTLGLPDLRDGSGERLWYALSPNFHDGPNVINSNTAGTLLVYDNSGTTLLTPPGSEAIAIIFSAGDVVASQQRDAANQNIATNYLDTGPNSINNATPNIPAGGPFIAADTATSFNDRLMIIRARDLIPVVEKRVAKEIKGILTNFKSAIGVYPYPAKLTNCTLGNCDSDPKQCRGWIPLASEPQDWSVPGNNWSLPAWFISNDWYLSMHYSADTSVLGPYNDGGGGSWSASCSNPLNISGSPTNMLFFMSGTPLTGQTRPSTSLADYLEDAENQNMDSLYVAPTPVSNDSLYTLP